MKDESPDYKTIKLDLKQAIKSNEKIIGAITESIIRTNTIVRSAMFLLKDYVLNDPVKNIPQINEDFLDIMLQSVCVFPTCGRKSTTFAALREKLTNHYDKTLFQLNVQGFEKPTYTHLNTVLDYAAKSWMTMIVNNITQRYVTYVETYVNFSFSKRKTLEDLKANQSDKAERKKEKYSFLARLRKIKNDLLNVGNEKNDLQFGRQKLGEGT
jgi:hypothetical protein